MEPDRGLTSYEEPPPQPRDLLSSSWCSSAIHVLQTEPKDYSMALVENPVPMLETEKKDLFQVSAYLVLQSAANTLSAACSWSWDEI
jgi:hypothetical protein